MSERLDRQLAKQAAEVLPDVVDGELHTVARSVPVLVHTNGITAATAYLLSRSAQPGDRYDKIAGLLLQAALEVVGKSMQGGNLARLDAVMKLDDLECALAERRARALAVWVSRIASAKHVEDKAPTEAGTAE